MPIQSWMQALSQLDILGSQQVKRVSRKICLTRNIERPLMESIIKPISRA